METRLQCELVSVNKTPVVPGTIVVSSLSAELQYRLVNRERGKVQKGQIERERERGRMGLQHSGDHVHECEWYRRTATDLYQMLSGLPSTCDLCAQCAG